MFLSVHRRRLHREQVEIEVIELEQDAKQLGLVAHRAAEDGFAVWLVGNRQRVKPLAQRDVEMTVYADLIDGWLCFHAHSIAGRRVECRPPWGGSEG